MPSFDSNNYRYIPSGTTVESVIESLNDYLSVELALPGNWSPQIFYFDVKTFPVKSKQILASKLLDCLFITSPDYLDYFQQTRGYSRPSVGSNPDNNTLESLIWDTFRQGSVMLYFEAVFLSMLHQIQDSGKLDPINTILLGWIKVLSKYPVHQWDTILGQGSHLDGPENTIPRLGVGACNYLYFVNDPVSYAQLSLSKLSSVHSNKIKRNPLYMTDFELLEGLSSEVSAMNYPGRIHLNGSRSDLIRLYQEKVSAMVK